ncbi:MAG: nucleotide pyrophosphohydrolase [Streptococcaceae bacterium]|jgi:NTP pyrophosphatase (non-canonical NTP hydrolase)|nr:nucleotide pyrophosphohydrolase [Streptococcaceae bacterium]
MQEFDSYNKKNLSEMQKELDVYISQFKDGYFSPMSQVVRLTEEVGELAREVMNTYGEKKKKESEPEGSIKEELTDVLVVTMLIANQLDIDLTSSFDENLAKFYKRDIYRFPRVDGREG